MHFLRRQRLTAAEAACLSVMPPKKAKGSGLDGILAAKRAAEARPAPPPVKETEHDDVKLTVAQKLDRVRTPVPCRGSAALCAMRERVVGCAGAQLESGNDEDIAASRGGLDRQKARTRTHCCCLTTRQCIGASLAYARDAHIMHFPCAPPMRQMQTRMQGVRHQCHAHHLSSCVLETHHEPLEQYSHLSVEGYNGGVAGAGVVCVS